MDSVWDRLEEITEHGLIRERDGSGAAMVTIKRIHEAAARGRALEAENTRLRAALEQAPDPRDKHRKGFAQVRFKVFSNWYDGLRAEALDSTKP